jgi:hypothetical protein
VEVSAEGELVTEVVASIPIAALAGPRAGVVPVVGEDGSVRRVRLSTGAVERIADVEPPVAHVVRAGGKLAVLSESGWMLVLGKR